MANIFRVTLTQLMSGQQIQNVIHFTGPSSDPLQLSTLADDVQANWIPQVRASQSVILTYIDIAVKMLESQFPTFHKTVNLPATGGGGNNTNVAFLAAVWRLRGNIIGRHGRGRLYIAGMHQQFSTDGIINAASINVWRNFQNNIMGVYGPGGSSPFRLVICPSKPPFNTVDVISMDIAPTWGTQRRRNIGRGI